MKSIASVLLGAVIVLLLIGLGACMPSGQVDLRAALANAQATQLYAENAMIATEHEIWRQNDLATQVAMRTANAAEAEIRLMQERSTATWSAWMIQQSQLEATRAAFDRDATGTQIAGASATAWPATATVGQAQLNAVVRAEQAAQIDAFWRDKFVTPAKAVTPTLFVLLLASALMAAGYFAYRRLMPVMELRAGTIDRGDRNAPLVLLRLPGGTIVALDLDRSFGPAVQISGNGVQTTGLAPTHALQSQVTAQDQMVDLTAALPDNYMLPQPGEAAPQAPHIDILPAPGPIIQGWMDDVDEKLLLDGEV